MSPVNRPMLMNWAGCKTCSTNGSTRRTIESHQVRTPDEFDRQTGKALGSRHPRIAKPELRAESPAG